MTTAFAQRVLPFLADLIGRDRYVSDYLTQHDADGADTISIPSIDDSTVSQTGAQSLQDITPAELSLVIGDSGTSAFANRRLSKKQYELLMGGNVAIARQVAENGFLAIKNDVDDTVVEYMTTSLAGSSADYVVNPAADSLADDDILNAIAKARSNAGGGRRLALFFHPYGEASLANLSGFVPPVLGAVDPSGMQYSVPYIGAVNGVPIYRSQSIKRRRTIASTAYANVSNVQTITVASGHGLVAGEKVTFDTVTAGGDVATPVAIDSVTATTIVIANAGGDSSASEAGTITVEACENLLLDLDHMHYGRVGVGMPDMREVEDTASSGMLVHISMLWGRVGRAGYAFKLCSPPSSI